MKTYVNNAYGTLKKVLLCPIDNYQIMPINFVAKKWMAEGHQMDYELCKKQHEALQKAYRDNGVEVELMDPSEIVADDRLYPAGESANRNKDQLQYTLQDRHGSHIQISSVNL